MADYYVSPNGTDTADGTSGAPWQTINRVNAAPLGAYDRVLFERDGTYPGQIRPPDNINPSLPGWLRYGAYGDGGRPVISGYTTIATWAQEDADTWRATFPGSGNVGFLRVDGAIHGQRRFTLAALASQWEFYCEANAVYVRSTADPASLAGSIQASTDADGVHLHSGVEVADLAITGHGAHGIRALGRGKSSRGRVLRCDLTELGGSVLAGSADGTTRYGNGYQAWVGSANQYVEGCTIRDCYDVALTAQGTADGGWDTFNGITWRRNLTYRNSQSMEFWYDGPGPGFVNVEAERNTCLLAGYGWGSEVRPEQESRVHLLTFDWGTAGPNLTRNVFSDATEAFAFRSVPTPGLSGSRNIILLRAGTKMAYQDAPTIENGQEWATSAGLTDTRVMVLPAGAPTDPVVALVDLAQHISTGTVVSGPSGPRSISLGPLLRSLPRLAESLYSDTYSDTY